MSPDYATWLAELNAHIRAAARLKASQAMNSELVWLYWWVGNVEGIAEGA